MWLPALLSAIGSEKQKDEGGSPGSPDEGRAIVPAEEEETEEERVAREEARERDEVAKAIDVWEEAALGKV